MNLFELFVKIGVDDQASGKLKDLGGKLGNGLKTAAKVGTAAVATVTAATTAMTAAFIKGTSEVAQYGDNIDKMSQKMGLSAKAYQEWDFIMQHSGTSMETLKASMKTLANAVDSGNDAFQRLGISQNEIASLNQEELFARTIEELQKVEDTTERTYLAGQLLGRGATELGALLNTSAEDTEAMRKQVHELGGVMSNEAVKAAAAYQDSLQNMQTAFSGIQRGMLSEFLPSMVTVMDGLALIFSGNDSGIAKITEGVNQFADKLMEAVPKIFELGEGILSSLATAILDNLPTLTSTATSVIIKLVDGIVSALPVLAESAVEIISSLTQGLSDNLPTLTSTATSAIIKLVDGIVSALPVLAESAVEIISSLTQGLSGSLPTITESAVELISVLTDGILNMLPEIVKMGLELLVSLATGIANNLDTLIPAVIQTILQIVETLTSPDNLSKILSASLTLVLKLAYGIIEAIPKLVDSAFLVIDNLVTFLTDPSNLAMLVSTSLELIVALAGGLIAAIPELVAAAGELIKSLVDKFKEKDWGQTGRDIIDKILSGLKNAWENVKSWFTNAWNNLFSNRTVSVGAKVNSGGVNGSHAGGLDYVPFDGYIAELHKGEQVLTASEAKAYRQGGGSVNVVQNIYSQAKTAADLMQEAKYQQERAVLLGV